jgi:hypothetical protein
MQDDNKLNENINSAVALRRQEIHEQEIREKELIEYRKRIQEQEKQLEQYSTRLKNEQLQREKELQHELEERERFYAERERKLYERQREFEENLLIRQSEMEDLRARLEHEVARRESELIETRRALQQEKELYKEESRKKIERTSKDYVSDALELLGKKESEFHNRSKTWSIVGASSLVSGLVFFGYVTAKSFTEMADPITWEFITFAVFKGLIAVVLFAALAKYSLLFSNSYMREALKNADRRHAINFGKFYLESYGAAADWTQIKEAFEHWNITGDNAFSKGEESKLDVTTIEKLATAIEKIGKSLPASSKD